MTDREPLRTNSAARLGRGEQENNYCLTNYCCRRESRSFVSTCPNLHKRVSNLKGGILRVIPFPPSFLLSFAPSISIVTAERIIEKKKIRSFDTCSSRYRRVSYVSFFSQSSIRRVSNTTCVYITTVAFNS